jgi:hypothetical protein
MSRICVFRIPYWRRWIAEDGEGASDIAFVIDALGNARSDGGDVIFEGEGLAGGRETGATGQDI